MNVELDAVVQRLGRTDILHGLTLSFGKGVLGLLGPNGAGKTTLLRTLGTILKPSSGSMKLLGFDPAESEERRALRRRLGYLPQTMGYYPGFTVYEFVEYFALLKEVPQKEVGPAVDEALEAVGLSDRASSKMRTLSGGMVRRVGIAQAIVNKPEILLLDEPTAGLDPEQRMSFRALVSGFGEGGTVVISTHLVEDVAAACDQVALLSNGKFLFRGTPDELIAKGSKETGMDAHSALERGYSAVLRNSGQ